MDLKTYYLIFAISFFIAFVIDRIITRRKKKREHELLDSIFNNLKKTNNGWVSVKDNLPTENKEYWVTTQYKDDEICTQDVDVLEYIDGEWVGEIPSQPVIAWKEYIMPVPYKEDE